MINFLSFGYDYLFSITFCITMIVVPIALGIGYWVCSLVDDHEESFKYPSPVKWCNCINPFFDVDGGEDAAMSTFASCVIVLGVVVINFVVVHNGGDLTQFMLYIVSGYGLVLVTRTVLRAGKAFKKHCTDPKAHT